MKCFLAMLLLFPIATAPAQTQFLPVQSIAEQFLFAAVNADREAQGLAPVHVDASLVQAAAIHAQEMARHSTISHQFPGEPELSQRASAAGARFSLVSENVAESSDAGNLHDLWMHSSGHRANILDPQVDAVGIAVVARHGQFFAVEDFARVVPALTLEQQESAVARLIQAAGIPVRPATNDARDTCRLSSGYKGTRQPGFVMRYTASSLTTLPEQLRPRLASGRYREAIVGACSPDQATPFSGYALAVLLYP